MIESEIPLRLDGGDTEMTDESGGITARVRLISIPKFKETGELVLVDTETLEVEVIRFGTFAGQEEKK
jgi:DNA polymerase delta subunit 2